MINFNRIKGIIIAPKKEWEQIDTEQTTISSLAITYALPLVLIGAIASFIAFGVIGVDVVFMRFRSMNLGIRVAFMHILSCGLSMAAAAIVIDMLAPNFQSEKNMLRSVQLVVYSYTPMLVASILLIIPSSGLAVLASLAGLYGLYVMYVGFDFMKKTPEDKKMPYFFTSIGCLIVVYIIVYFIIRSLLMPSFSSLSGL